MRRIWPESIPVCTKKDQLDYKRTHMRPIDRMATKQLRNFATVQATVDPTRHTGVYVTKVQKLKSKCAKVTVPAKAPTIARRVSALTQARSDVRVRVERAKRGDGGSVGLLNKLMVP